MERKARIIKEMARYIYSMIRTAKEILNRGCKHSSVLAKQSANKKLCKRRLHLKHGTTTNQSSNLKTFGCLCFSCIPPIKRNNLDKKSEPEICVHFNSTSK